MKIKFNHKTWIPINEMNEMSFAEFNKRFDIVMAFKFNTLFRKHFIRFVQHPDVGKDSIRIFYHSLPKTFIFWKWKGKKGNRILTNKKNLKIHEEVLLIKDAEIKYGIKLKK